MASDSKMAHTLHCTELHDIMSTQQDGGQTN